MYLPIKQTTDVLNEYTIVYYVNANQDSIGYESIGFEVFTVDSNLNDIWMDKVDIQSIPDYVEKHARYKALKLESTGIANKLVNEYEHSALCKQLKRG